MGKLHNENDESKRTLANNTSVNLENANIKPERNKSKFSKEKKILAGVALTLAVGIGGGMAANFAFNHHPASAISTSSSESISDNNSSETNSSSQTQEALPTVTSLEIGKDLFSNPEELSKTFFEKDLTDWLNAGATKENEEAAQKSGNINDYSVKLASEYDAVYIKALLPDDWKSYKTLSDWVSNIEAVHANTIATYFKTSSPELFPDDVEPYKKEVNFSSISRIDSAGGETIQFNAETFDSDNADKNRANSLGMKSDNSKSTNNYTFGIYGSTLKLQGYTSGPTL